MDVVQCLWGGCWWVCVWMSSSSGAGDGGCVWPGECVGVIRAVDVGGV